MRGIHAYNLQPGAKANGQRDLFPGAVLLIAILLGLAFLVYYSQTACHLRPKAGPDYHAHNDVTRFIAEHARLPVLPDDGAQLKFTVHGGTRALRPPLTYLLSASLSGVASYECRAAWNDQWDTFYRYRRGSVVLGALTVAVVLLATFAYVQHLGIAVLSALLVGLWPQIAFIFSYNNDDAGALFSVALLILGLVLIERAGPRKRLGALLGFAGGLIILSKPTAWLLLPTVLWFFLRWIYRFEWRQLAAIAGVAVVVGAVTGGWWLAFNAWHYGAGDILLTDITAKTAAMHTRLDADYAHGFIAKGVGIRELLINNYADFYTKTLDSTVGNLDWLRLQLRPQLYGFYVLLGAFVLLTGIIRGLRYLARTPARDAPGATSPQGAAWILYFACGFQFAMYVAVNLYNDIQLQGKYLLPVATAFVLLLAGSLVYWGSVISKTLNRVGIFEITLGHTAAGALSIGLLALIIVGLHRDAVVNYVIPFYKPQGFEIPLRQIHIDRSRFFNRIAERDGVRNDIKAIRYRGGSSRVLMNGFDPWFVLHKQLCRNARGNLLMSVNVTAHHADIMSLYWNDGRGFSEARRSRQKYPAGDSIVHLWLGTQNCTELRLDPGTRPGEIKIHSIVLSSLRIDPHTQ